MSSSLVAGDFLLNRYRVTEEPRASTLWISCGARDELEGGREVRVKLVHPQLADDEPSRAYALKEMQRVRLLQHPGIIRPLDVQLTPDGQRIVLVEPNDGVATQEVPLSEVVKRRRQEGGAFTLDEVRRIAVQLASALGYVHAQLMCHGDLRLPCVAWRREGVRLCDVGLGRALPRGAYLQAVEKSGELLMLAPEVRAGRPPDSRSDVFSLAVLYGHLLSMGEAERLEQLLRENAPLGSVLARGTHEDPQGRHQTVEALVADVESVALTGAPVRRRHAPTPVALAVAAGRLPVEELTRAPPAQDDEDAIVLAPTASAPSRKVSMGSFPPRRMAVPTADIDLAPARPVEKADLVELKHAAAFEGENTSEEDIGAMLTTPHVLMEPEAVSPKRDHAAPEKAPLRPAAPEGVAVLDTTALQDKVTPEELRRLDSVGDGPSDILTRQRPRAEPEALPEPPPQVPEPRSPAVLEFRELPPLGPDDAAADGGPPSAPHLTPEPPSPSAPQPGAAAGAEPEATPTVTVSAAPPPRPAAPPPAPAPLTSRSAQRKARPPPYITVSRRIAASYLLLSAVLGALTSLLVVSLNRRGDDAEDQRRGGGVDTPRTSEKERAPAPRPSHSGQAVIEREERQTPSGPAPSERAAKPVEPSGAAQAEGCPAGMVRVTASQPFCIDRHERPGVGQRPRVDITHAQAEDACRAQGLRLCTDAEWEAACRGKGRASFPYGHDPRPAVCNVRGGRVEPAGARAGCASAAGALDMSGNVAEWVQGGGVRGGSARGETDGRCSTRLKVPQGGRSLFVGYRCCL